MSVCAYCGLCRCFLSHWSVWHSLFFLHLWARLMSVRCERTFHSKFTANKPFVVYNLSNVCLFRNECFLLLLLLTMLLTLLFVPYKYILYLQMIFSSTTSFVTADKCMWMSTRGNIKRKLQKSLHNFFASFLPYVYHSLLAFSFLLHFLWLDSQSNRNTEYLYMRTKENATEK